MARDLSPYSARRLLTQQLVEGKTASPSPQTGNSRSGSPGRVSRHGSERPKKEPVASGRRSRSRSRERKPPPPSSREAKDATVEPDTVVKRDPSPEPYRKPRGPLKGSAARQVTGQETGSVWRQKEGFFKKQATRPLTCQGHGQRQEARWFKRETQSSRSVALQRPTAQRQVHPRTTVTLAPTLSFSQATYPLALGIRVSTPPNAVVARDRPLPHKRTKQPLPSQEVSFRGLDDSAQPPSKYGGAPPDKEKPNFKPTGALAKAANRVEGTKIILKYHEPAEARKPPASQPWRIFVFKGDDVVDTIELWQKSCWLLGRAHEVADYVLEHPSSSGQHAVIQFRYITKTKEDEFGVKSTSGKVKPYIIDLESSNGTELNGEDLEASRYFELRDKDVLKFGGSEREYVVMLPPPELK
ncbi:PRP38-assoc multi-domain protein [Pyrenophora tritici-repentis]|uniref:PRP38-assoc multi-domain protein n=1 Tax=Pyrenophora tritici-repentis TaxID=45151 RepID=A0A316ZX65_9PLEO|nr:PRP38-assoc multi-domain protein [Pyrenophora tritici-repentis]